MLLALAPDLSLSIGIDMFLAPQEFAPLSHALAAEVASARADALAAEVAQGADRVLERWERYTLHVIWADVMAASGWLQCFDFVPWEPQEPLEPQESQEPVEPQEPQEP